MLSITIPGKPVGKQRPRVTKRGHAYTPAKTGNYEALVQWTWIKEHGNTLAIEGPVWLTVVVKVAPPKSASKKARERMLSGEEKPTKKPDIDNILKTISDALNGLAYVDDKQIVNMLGRKEYAERDSVYIEIEEVK